MEVGDRQRVQRHSTGVAKVKRRKLDHAKLARQLGSAVRGSVKAPVGFFGALQLAESVRVR